jgi:2-oxoglutarate dehydrogenase E2 component (dihydrolipoamide succinyltransferase)
VSRVKITVPDLGMQSEEIIFGQWLLGVGERIEAGADLFEVEADKATVICEAPATGVLSELVVTGGQVQTGDVLGYLDAG